MKEGYKDEFKNVCLVLALITVLASPDLASSMTEIFSLNDSQMALIVCYASFLALVYALGITLDALILSTVKDFILYPSINGRGLLKPGCRVFKQIADGDIHDDRFSASDAKHCYRDQISRCKGMCDADSARFQNVAWYGLYRKYCNLASVKSANLGYLYSRDAGVLSLAVCVLGAVVDLFGLFAFGTVLVGIWGICAALVLALLCLNSARLKAKRLVTTVIACDMAATKDSKEEQ